MIEITPISISATAQSYCASVTENLCQAYCLTQTIQPVASITYSVGSINVVSGVAYVTIQAVGAIQYQPKGACGCQPQTKMFVESFDVAFVGTGTPTVAVEYTAGVNSPAGVKCCNNVYAYNIVGEVAITATFPS